MAVIVEVETKETKTKSVDKSKDKGKGLAAGERSAGFAEYLRTMAGKAESTKEPGSSGPKTPTNKPRRSKKGQESNANTAKKAEGKLGKKSVKPAQTRFTRAGSQIPEGGWFKATTSSSKGPLDDSSSPSSSGESDSESSTTSSDSSSSSESSSDSDSSSSAPSLYAARPQAKKNKMKYEKKKAEKAKIKNALAGIKIKAPFVWDAKPDLDIFDQWTYEADTWVELYGLADKVALRLMVNFMSGSASKFFMKHVATHQKEWTVKKVYEALFDYCFLTDFKLRLRKRLMNAYQGKNKVRDFVRDVQALATRFPDVTERQLVQIFWDEQLEAIHEELKLLPGLIRINYTKWTDGGKPFQLQCMGAQKLGQDVLLHAATGAGKTGVAAGPHLLPSSKGKVTLMVSPLLSLHDEQVSTFQKEFGLKATAINSSNGGCTKAVMEKVVAGEWQIVMLSPEMILSRRFIDGVLRKWAFASRCLSVFIDEAHVVSHWGASFRKKYASIGIIRAFLPRTTPVIAVTATLTRRVHQDLVTKLQFNPKDYVFCSIGNDRPNVSQVIRSMEHAANSYRDLDFLVLESMTSPEDVKKPFCTPMTSKIIDHLNARVCDDYRSRGLVRPYNAGRSRQYREEVMSLFKAGIIRILVCTDAAGMGCDIPDIELVVQWKAPQNLSSWVQRAGRTARGPEATGMAVMLRRGWYKGINDSITALPDSDTDIPQDAPAEGLYALIQSTICRRIILSRVFKNTPPTVPKEDCCDICNPKLFDRVRPSKPIRAVRQKGIRKGPAVDSVRVALFSWRRNIKKMHYAHGAFAPHAILDDATCELLASIGPAEAIEP
ncbi:P-loop containing nucleoside triphosphate hydrolase protein [Mycena leptocephala]|nr:P-loop containing nucleoside triphosphate hydrolase protein [Mycena leptocephala]